jgi:hypothetical protein
VLVHKPGKENDIANPFSHPACFQVTDAEDNRDRLVLNPSRFVMLATTAFAKPLESKQRI